MRQVMVGALLVWVGIAAVPGVAAAQTPSADGNKVVELAAGYQFQRFGLDDGMNMKVGAFIDLALGKPAAQGVLQVGASVRSIDNSFSSGSTTFSSENSFTAIRFMGGVRTRSQGTGVTGYGHLLAGGLMLRGSGTSITTGPGGTHTSEFSDSEIKFSAQLGAGINVPTSARTHLRLGLDYQRVFVEGGGNIYLASVGLAFRLGR